LSAKGSLSGCHDLIPFPFTEVLGCSAAEPGGKRDLSLGRAERDETDAERSRAGAAVALCLACKVNYEAPGPFGFAFSDEEEQETSAETQLKPRSSLGCEGVAEGRGVPMTPSVRGTRPSPPPPHCVGRRFTPLGRGAMKGCFRIGGIPHGPFCPRCPACPCLSPLAPPAARPGCAAAPRGCVAGVGGLAAGFCW